MKGSIKELQKLYLAVKAMQFNTYDKITISAMQSSFKSLDYWDKTRHYPDRCTQKIPGGTVEFIRNSIKLIMTELDYSKPIRPQFLDAIRYLIEKKFIRSKNTNTDTLNYYLRKFQFNEVEINAFFQRIDIFEKIKDDIDSMNDEEIFCYLQKYGSRNIDVKKVIDLFQKLNSYPTSLYFRANNSSKLFMYNMTAKEDHKRPYHIEGDRFKAELTLKRDWFEKQREKGKIKGLDFNLIKSPIIKKLTEEAYKQIISPFWCDYASELIYIHLQRSKRANQ